MMKCTSTGCLEVACFYGERRQPLCDVCGHRRKEAHEKGLTILSSFQKKRLRRILPYPLIPIDKS